MEARKTLQKLDNCIHNLLNIKDGKKNPDINMIMDKLETEFSIAMDDDLNISAGMAAILKNVKKVNSLIQTKKIDKDNSVKLIEKFRNIDSVLQIFNFESKYTDQAVQYLLKERIKARKEKNWDKADKIREQLLTYGIHIQDSKS